MFFLHLVELQDQEDFILERTIHAPLKLQMHRLQLYMLFLSYGIYCAIPYIHIIHTGGTYENYFRLQNLQRRGGVRGNDDDISYNNITQNVMSPQLYLALLSLSDSSKS